MRQRETQDVEAMARETGEYGMSPAVLAAGASVALSWYYFFVRQDRNMGVFVGLWPPTILAFASYFNQREMRKQIQTVTRPGSAIREAIEGVVGSR